MKIIGLTGGIGTGKSTVSAYLAQKGCKIIDADLISHQMTEAGSPCLAEIRDAFGEDVFLRDGNLDRKKVGRLVFADATKKKTLEQIITRRVIEKTLRILQDCRAQQEDLVVLDAPLLFECGMQRYTDETWLVVCRTETRLRRIAARDGLAEEDIQNASRIRCPRNKKKNSRITSSTIRGIWHGCTRRLTRCSQNRNRGRKTDEG